MAPIFCLVLFCAIVTLVMQQYVGARTIYAPELAARRDSVHEFVLTNSLPAGHTWQEYGGQGMNVRVLTVYLAERIHRAVHWSVQRTYFVLDTLALFASLLALYALLRLWVPPPLALIGLLFTCAMLPLTYALHYFHPWDRPSFLLWIVLVYLLRRDRLVLFAALLVIAVLVKYDVVLLPGLYFLAQVRKDNALRVTVVTGALFLLAFGVYEGLVYHYGVGLGEKDLTRQAVHNLTDLRSFHVWYPPLLGLSLPLVLALVGFRGADRFAQAGVVFALLFCLPLFFLSNFVEFRAEMPVLLLLLPCALTGLHSLLSREPRRIVPA